VAFVREQHFPVLGPFLIPPSHPKRTIDQWRKAWGIFLGWEKAVSGQVEINHSRAQYPMSVSQRGLAQLPTIWSQFAAFDEPVVVSAIATWVISVSGHDRTV
jgi:hypothetical protein